MKIVLINKFYFDKSDYAFIKQQIKEKKLKIKNLAKECGLKRRRLYDIFNGYCCCPEKVIKVLKDHEIVIPYCDFYVEEN